jgi:hypothetical protein
VAFATPPRDLISRGGASARRHPGLKVLYVSGYADDAFAHEQEWGNAFLSKPFSLETLAQRVQDGLTSV